MNDERTIRTRAEAREMGLKRYFTGKPCKHGHVCERYTSDMRCLDCNRKNARNSRRAARAAGLCAQTGCQERAVDGSSRCKSCAEANRKTARARYAANPELYRSRCRRWRNANRELLRTRARERRAANPEEARRRERMWYAANPELYRARHREWSKTNPEICRVHNSLRRAAKLRAIPLWAYPGDTLDEQRAARAAHHAAIDNGSRAIKSFVIPDYWTLLKRIERERVHMSEFLGCDMHLDHWQAISRGGEHCPVRNLRIISAQMNLSKGDKMPGTEWTPPPNTFEQVTYVTRIR